MSIHHQLVKSPSTSSRPSKKFGQLQCDQKAKRQFAHKKGAAGGMESRSGEGALAVDIVVRFIAASIAVILQQLPALFCDQRHKPTGAGITSP